MSESMTLTLPDFLLARIAEDEAWGWGRTGFMSMGRVQRRCEGMRRIVERESATLTRYPTNPYAVATLTDLAAAYADHPDFREEWRA